MSGSITLSHLTEEELNDEDLYSELAWCLESDEEGSVQSAIHWSSDEEGSLQSEIHWSSDVDEETFWPVIKNDEEREFVYSESEPSQVLTAEELLKSGRRYVTTRLVSCLPDMILMRDNIALHLFGNRQELVRLAHPWTLVHSRIPISPLETSHIRRRLWAI